MSNIAMAHGINANWVFKWRREHCKALSISAGPAQASAPALLPITLASATRTEQLPPWALLRRPTPLGEVVVGVPLLPDI